MSLPCYVFRLIIVISRNLYGTFLQNNNAIKFVVWEETIFKGFDFGCMATRILHGTQLFEGI